MTKGELSMKVAMVSEHASPLAALGGVDAGGQNVHVGALATEIARQGHHVTVHPAATPRPSLPGPGQRRCRGRPRRRRASYPDA